MNESPEHEHQLNLAVRDAVARNSTISVLQLQHASIKGTQIVDGLGQTLHWEFVAKLVREQNCGRALAARTRRRQAGCRLRPPSALDSGSVNDSR